MTTETDAPTTAEPMDGVPASVLAIPLVMLSAFAALGQSLWAYQGLDASIHGGWQYRAALIVVLAVGVAVTLEAVSLVLAAMAHAARMARDSAMPRQVASYTVGAAVAWMNYDHWSHQNAHGLEWVFAAFSLMSPIMWASWSKGKHRRELRAAGLIDPRTVRFSAARWALWFGETFRALRAAVRAGINDPQAAVGLLGESVTEATPKRRGASAPAAPTSGQPVQPEPAPTPTTGRAIEPTTTRPAITGGTGHTCDDTCQIRSDITDWRHNHPGASQKAVAEGLGKSRTTIRAHWPDGGDVVPLRDRTERTGS